MSHKMTRLLQRFSFYGVIAVLYAFLAYNHIVPNRLEIALQAIYGAVTFIIGNLLFPDVFYVNTPEEVVTTPPNGEHITYVWINPNLPIHQKLWIRLKDIFR